MSIEQTDLEEACWYMAGLSADGVELDYYLEQAIIEYGRLLVQRTKSLSKEMENTEENKPWPLEWGDEILGRLKQELENKREIAKELEHIKKPYSVPEILRQYRSGGYEAELLLQHTLKHLTTKYQ